MKRIISSSKINSFLPYTLHNQSVTLCVCTCTINLILYLFYFILCKYIHIIETNISHISLLGFVISRLTYNSILFG